MPQSSSPLLRAGKVDSLIKLLILITFCNSVSAQTCLPGNVHLSSQASVNSFATNYPGCSEVLGNIIISGNVDSLNGLEQLTKIHGNLQLESSANIKSFSGLDNVIEIGGFLYTNNSSLESLSGLDGLRKVGSYVFLANNALLVDISGLANLDTIVGYLDIIGNTALHTLNGFDNLRFIGDHLRIQANTSLKNFSGLGSLSYLGADLQIVDNDSLVSLSGMENLDSIEVELNIYRNVLLTELSGLSDLQKINGRLTIAWNGSLTSLCGLENLNVASLTQLNILNNAQLSDCELQNFCPFIGQAGPGGANISGNKSGCLFPAEVTSACGPGLDICCGISIDTLFVTDVECYGSNGSINALASCMTCTSLQYSLDSVLWQSESLFSGLTAGLYTYFVRDSLNTSCLASQQIAVGVDIIPPSAVCQNITVFLNSYGHAQIKATDLDGGSYDDCEIRYRFLDRYTFDLTHDGLQSVLLSVRDVGDNISSCSGQVMVVDTFGLQFGCRNASLYLNESGEATLEPDSVLITSASTDFKFLDSGQSLGDDESYHAALGDLDGDGDLDAFVACRQSSSPDPAFSRMYRNDGSGNLTDNGKMYPSASRVLLEDIDGDLDLDVVLLTHSEWVEILLNINNDSLVNTNQMLMPDSAMSGLEDSRDVDMADLDGDGDLDIYLSVRGGNRVFLNNGQGTFTQNGSSLGSGVSENTELADIDNDGDIDAVVANFDQDRLWLNDGDATFVESPQVLGGAVTRDIHLIDLDYDGDIDALFAGGINSSHIQQWRNDGNGIFTNIGPVFTDLSNPGIIRGDLDGDTDDDFIIRGNGNLRNYLLINDGFGDFTVLQDSLISTLNPDILSAGSGVLGDLDNDGYLDLFVVNNNLIPNRVIYNRSIPSYINTYSQDSLTYTLSQSVFTCEDLGPNQITITATHMTTSDMGTCDLTITVLDSADHCCDIAIENITTYGNSCLEYPGGVAVIYATCSECTAIQYSVDSINWISDSIVDLDIFGEATIYVRDSGNIQCNASQTTVLEPMADNTPPFANCQDTTIYLDETGVAVLQLSMIDAASFDNCGITSYGLSRDTFYCVDVGINDVQMTVSDSVGNTSMCSAQITVLDVQSPMALCKDTVSVYLDIDGNIVLNPISIDGGSTDGCDVSFQLDQDILSCADMGFVAITLTVSDPSGNSNTCQSIVQVLDTIAPVIVCKDITVELGDEGVVKINSNLDETKLFLESGQEFPDVISWDIDVGDLDGDGDLDIYDVAHTQGTVLTNDGTGTFLNSNQNMGGKGVVLGDFDGDRDLDAFLTSTSKILLNDGSGIFTSSSQDFPNCSAADIGDLDGDGDLDIFMAHFGGTRTVWFNDGSGNFHDLEQNLDQLSAGLSILDIKLVDVDNDNDLDVIEAIYSSYINSNLIHYNDGGGNFSNQHEFGETSRKVDVGDIDGDGDLDIVLAHAYRPWTLWLNDGEGIFSFSGMEGNTRWSTAVSLGDIDNDGDLDLISTPWVSSPQIWLNDGTGFLTLTEFTLGRYWCNEIITEDFNSDGYLDVLFALRNNFEIGNQSNLLWINQGFSHSILDMISNNCASPDIIVALSKDSFDISDVGIQQVTVTATDASGNSAQCIANVTISDCGCNPMSSPMIPNSESGLHTADCKSIDGDFTHFCDSQGRLLLSIDTETAHDLDPTDVTINIQAGAFYYDQFCSSTPGSQSGSCFIVSPDGAAILCRTWDVNSGATDATVRYYFNQSDIDIVNQEIYMQGLNPVTNPNQLWFYKVLSGAGHAKPQDLAATDVRIIDNDGTGIVSESNWKLGMIPDGYFAEYAVSSFSGGGGGGAERGSSPVCPPIIASISGDGMQDSLGLNSIVFVQIDGGQGPYKVVLSDGTTVEDYMIGDSIEVFTGFIAESISLLSVIDSNTCPHSQLVGEVPQFISFGDTVAPVAVCKDTTLALNVFGQAFISAEMLDGGSSDDQIISMVYVEKSSYGCADLGTVLVDFIIFDQSGNSDTCQSMITITDPLGTCCPATRDIYQIPSTDKTYQADQIINSDAVIRHLEGGVNIFFRAGDQVNLLPTFEVEAGSSLQINMEGCE